MKQRQLLTFLLLLLVVFSQSCSTDSATQTQMRHLNLTAEPAEGGVLLPEITEFEDGSVVEITATPNEHWIFNGWAGDLTGDQNPVSMTMDANKNIVGIFIKRDYPLVLEETEGGSVRVKVLQIKSSTYPHGTVLELTAIPDDGWEFDHWEGSLEGDENPVIITVEEEFYVKALFRPMDLPLTIEIEGEGVVYEQVQQAKTTIYPYGTAVKLTPEAAEGWRFERWEGDLSGSEYPQTVLVDKEISIKAVFSKREYSLNTSIIGEGTISEKIIQLKSTDYEFDTTVELEALPEKGWRFIRWEGYIEGNENPVIITIKNDVDVRAVFEKNKYSLTIEKEGEGDVQEKIVQSKKTEYSSGSIVELTAIPKDGWKFSTWSGDITGSANPVQLTVNENKTIKAHFKRKIYQLNISKSGEGTVTKSILSGKEKDGGYEFESVVKLTAKSKSGWSFVSWSGDISGNENPATIQMDGDRSITANFEQDKGKIRVTTTTSGDNVPSHYTVEVNGISKSIGSNSKSTFSDLLVGLYQVELKNIPKHCTVDGSNPVDVNVNKNNTTSVQFVISCKVTELSGQILFQSNRDGSPAIYKMKPDGSVVDQFTGGHSILLTPRESPDGSAIAFSEADMLQECTETRIIILNPDGSHKSNFTGFETCTEHLYPSWSTNGNKIAYISISPYGYTDAAIYKMRPDGSDKEKIKGFDTHITTLKGLDWSPTEGKLVYSYNEDLFTMTSDGANNTNLTSAFDLEATNPRWSPDAKKILFTANKDGKLEIFVMNANGTNPVNLTNNTNFDDTHASWSPDGKHIVFMSNRDGLSEIYTMKADGSSQVNITNNSSTSNDRNPEWIQN